MANRAKRHVHKYYKIELGYVKVWACALPDCNHYMPTHMEKMVVGKASLCWSCGAGMLLDEIVMQNDRPVCYNCKSETGSGLSEADIAEVLAKVNAAKG